MLNCPHCPPLNHRNFDRYVGNYYYTLNNKLALKAAGGATGFPVTIGFMQLMIGSLYALFLWLAPDCRPLPNVDMDDLMKVRRCTSKWLGCLCPRQESGRGHEPTSTCAHRHMHLFHRRCCRWRHARLARTWLRSSP